MVVAMVTMVCALVVWSKAPVATELFANKETIFVSIASYRDTDCSTTLKNMFENADDPNRVFAGVCEQNTASSKEVCLATGFKWHDQVRRVSIPSTEAKGPTYARYLCSTLYRGETYFCQLDSHMRFTKGWDTAVIAMLKKCPSEKPVLSHYPHDYGNEATEGVPVLCKSKLDPATGLATLEAVTMAASGTPKPVPFVAGGFMFGPGTIAREVPYDPGLDHLFQGEELLYSARLWTSGYDMFTPTANVVTHHYYRKGAAKFWDDLETKQARDKTLVKVRALLSGTLASYPYGMGTARSLGAYWDYAKIDLATKTFDSEGTFCK